MATQNLTTRRGFSKLLLGADVATTACMPVTAPAGAQELHDLIEHHRTAWQTFEDFCRTDHGYDAEYDRLNSEEEKALDAVCGAPTQSMADARTKAVYLDNFLKHSELTAEQVTLLLRSFLPAVAA